jgi:transposase InsO family protein
MSAPILRKEWFSSAELSALGLPGLSTAKRKVNERAEAEGWALRTCQLGNPLARNRAGRGGGVEYHASVLPIAARLELVRRGLAPEPVAGPKVIGGEPPVEAAPAPGARLWDWYATRPARVQKEAERRLSVLCRVEAAELAGLNRSAAVATAALQAGVAGSTIWEWFSLVAGAARTDWLPVLAPRPMGGGKKAEIDDDVWTFFKSDWLRPERPTLSTCYRRTQEFATSRGLAVPHLKTLQRRIERDVPPSVVAALRNGAEAVRKILPPQIRTVANLHALEIVNIDGHKWDVFVKFPATAAYKERIARPMMVAIQDVYSRKILAWRFGDSENAVLTRLVFADLFQKWGIPDAVLLDNGRAFASKWITGGAATRFRFKILEDEPLGLLTQLQIRNMWATPYRGQSKPIERAFRDFCDAIAKHPAFAGAYTGNKPDAKPENYGSRAVDFDLFEKVVARGIAEHNARQGRRTEMAHGRSFDDAWAESYAVAPIRKAAPEHLRRALLAAERRRSHRETGAITLMGNRYWTPELGRHAGQLMTVRFDPDNLHSEVHVYDQSEAFVVSAPIWEAVGFADAEAARQRARLEAEHRRVVKRDVELQELLEASDLAKMLPLDIDEDEAPQPTVIRPVRTRGNAAVALAPAPQAPDDFNRDEYQRRTSAALESRLRLVRDQE